MPLMALFVGAWAGNKVEALALAKTSSIIMWTPLFDLFIPEPWHLVGLISPIYGMVRLLDSPGVVLLAALYRHPFPVNKTYITSPSV